MIAASRRFLGALDQVLVREPAQVPGHDGITHLHGEGAVAVEIGRTRRGAARGVVVRLVVAGRRGPPRGAGERPQGVLRPGCELVGVRSDVIDRPLDLVHLDLPGVSHGVVESASVTAHVFWMNSVIRFEVPELCYSSKFAASRLRSRTRF